MPKKRDEDFSMLNPILRFLKWLYEFPAWVGQKLDQWYEEDEMNLLFDPDHVHWSEEDF